MKVVNVNIRAVVRGIRGQGQIRVLFPGDTDIKTIRTVMEVLREEDTVMRTPDLSDPECSSFEEYKQDPDILSLDILEEDVMCVT